MAGTFTNLLYHVIFSTKNREALISPDLQPHLFTYIGGIIRGEEGELLDAGGVWDHVHLLALFPARVSVADMLRRIKGGSSVWINERHQVPGHFAWQGGYGAFSVSESGRDAVAQYIADQEEHHRVTTFQEEFVTFLRRHQIPFDERYIWE